jgi:RND family efflux transporter MFP subunit
MTPVMEMRRWIWTLGLLTTLGLAACGHPAPEEVESGAVVPVRTETATTGTIRGVVYATGIVSPAPGAELVVIAPEAAKVAEIPHGEGEPVRRDDLLVRFEIPGAAAEVERQAAEIRRAQAAVANALANQARARDLFERGVSARKEIEDADRQLADAQASLEQAQASQAAAATVATRSVVRATFDGLVAKRYHNPGDVVEPSAENPVLRVIDPRRLEVVASVPLADELRVVPSATGRLVAAPAGSAPAGLKVISRPSAVDPGSATVPVRLTFDRPTNLPAGTPVQVEIDAEKHTGVVLVAESAIVREGEETAVFIAMGDKAVRRVVKTGLSADGRIEILSGVAAGEKMIVGGHAGLPDGAAITTPGVVSEETPVSKGEP